MATHIYTKGREIPERAFAAMEILELVQGEPAWHEFRRDPANHPASYAAVVLGRSPFMSRLELLDAYATGIWPEPSDFQLEIFAKGHRVEALYRPRAAEFLAQDLYPVVGRRTWPSLRGAGVFRLSASMDGFWEDEQGNWECKWLNDDLRAALPHSGWSGCEKNDARMLPQFYRDQMEQQCLVMGKERVLFVACDFADDGTMLDERLCWYESDPDLAAEIVAGWKQFDADLITHKPIPKAVKVVAETVEALPALTSRVDGTLTVTHNFKLYGEKLRAYIATLPTQPKTDQDFANLRDAVKRLDAAEKALDAEENRALASLAPVNEMRTAKATLSDYARTTRLKIDKVVTSHLATLRMQIQQEHQQAFDAWVLTQNQELGAPLLSTSLGTIKDARIAEAMSGKKSVQGWREGAAQAVADAKVAVTAIVERVQTNQAAFKELVTEEAHRALFADLNQQLFKDPEVFRIVVGSRISDWRAKEEKRLEDERAKIRAEEEARAAQKARAEQPAATPAPTPEPSRAGFDFSRAGRVFANEPGEHAERARQQREEAFSGAAATRPPGLTPEPLPPATTEGAPTLTITALNTKLKFTVTAGFLESLGISPASSEGNAKRYHQEDLPRICIAIRNHLLGVMAAQKQQETLV